MTGSLREEGDSFGEEAGAETSRRGRDRALDLQGREKGVCWASRSPGGCHAAPIAIEEALRLREAGAAVNVIAATVCPVQAAVHVLHGSYLARPLLLLVVAKILRAFALQESPGLVILGKQIVTPAASVKIVLYSSSCPFLSSSTCKWN